MSFEEKANAKELARNFAESGSGDGGGINYPIPANINEILKKITQNDPISYALMSKIIGSESGFDTKARSPKGAMGIGQFTTPTLLEIAYKQKKLLPEKYQKIVDKNIEKVNTAAKGKDPVYEYRFVEGADEKAVRSIAYNAEPGLILTREHIRQATKSGTAQFRSLLEESIAEMEKPKNVGECDNERLDALKKHLKRPMTFVDVKTFYMAGARGGAKILAAYADPQKHNHRAGDYTAKRSFENNKNVFMKDPAAGVHRSVTEYYEYMEERLGKENLSRDLSAAHERTASAEPLTKPKAQLNTTLNV